MCNHNVAFIGWHEGSAGQVHSWFEAAGSGKVAFFIHPYDTYPEVIKTPRAVANFSYPEDLTFKKTEFVCTANWPEFLIDKGITRVLVTLSDPRERWYEIEKAVKNGFEVVNAIHPSALFLNECILGQNVIIHAKCVIGYRAEIDDGVIINTGAQIDHHCKLQKAVTIDPAVVLAGNVLIEEYCILHTRSTVINKIVVGRNSVIAAGAVVVRNVEPNSLIMGVPGRKIER
ncbi:acetyltransferase [Leptospira santarosai]|uniref:acetyltransferase n=1 Tax=Leptospira santarosai TaxID=28183 RepID=UPI0002BF59D5|nr:acetyltransferase [Leptospira santarosai]EMO24374.1 transferase hexapeptide repeat protein [Leptospira santarosai str. HAI134]MDI7182303.1 acetyltransferase [Leptospira santarosai]